MTFSGDVQSINSAQKSSKFESFDDKGQAATAASLELLNSSGAWSPNGGKRQFSQIADAGSPDSLLAFAPTVQKEAAGPRIPFRGRGPTPEQSAALADSADELFDDQIKGLQAAGRPAKEIAELHVKKAANHSDAAMKNVDTLATDPTSKARYRDQLQKAINSLGQAIKVMENENGNADIATRAQLLGDLGLWEMSRADVKGDADAVNAGKHYDEAIALWKKFDPAKYGNQAQINAAAELKDKSMLIVFAQAHKLHTANGDAKRAEAAAAGMQEIMKRHPGILEKLKQQN